MNLTTATPVEIDTKLAEIYGRLAKAEAAVATAQDRIERYQARQEEKAAGGFVPYDTSEEGLNELRDRYEAANAVRWAVFAEATPLETEYNRRPWNRYYLVDNSNGHVHRSTQCRTCYATTQFTWLVDLADFTDEQVVAEAGSLTCLECFPGVRTEILAQRPTELVEPPAKRAARKEREEKKAAKAKADAEKAIIDPATGEALREISWSIRQEKLVDGPEIKNWKTAQGQLIDALAMLRGYGYGRVEKQAIVDRFIPALAKKRGMTEAELLADLEKRVAKKARDWYGA